MYKSYKRNKHDYVIKRNICLHMRNILDKFKKRIKLLKLLIKSVYPWETYNVHFVVTYNVKGVSIRVKINKKYVKQNYKLV